jgi:hypothetical protein
VEPEFDVRGGKVRQEARALKQSGNGAAGGLRQPQIAARTRPLSARRVNNLDESKINFGQRRQIKINVLIFFKLRAENCHELVSGSNRHRIRNYHGVAHHFLWDFAKCVNRFGANGGMLCF